MKKIMFMLLAMVSIAFVACDKDDDTTLMITTTNVNNTVMSGTWRVTYYWDTDHEETSNYSSYAFAFSGGNVVTAVSSGSTVTGTWATGTDDSKVKLVLNFISPASFAELSEDWQVIERTDTKIRLQHVSGGSGGTDYLTFERN